MRYNKLFLLMAITLYSILSSCSKSGDKPGENNGNTQKQYPAPNWQTTDASTLAYSMTAVIAVSDSLKQTVSTGDEMAAFIGDECRGIGVYVERDSATPVFYVLIKGAADESGYLSFKYYNKQSRYMYSTDEIIHFKIDDNYGTVDDPAIPMFEPM
jgi:hypothetical protein